MAKKKRKIGACEWLEKIAHNLHFDAKKAWDDAGNKTLRDNHPDPNLICEGHILEVPELEQKEVNGATDTTHKFKVKGKATAKLNLKLEHHVDSPLEEEYELEIGGKTFKGTSTNGEIKHEIPIKSDVGMLRLPKRKIELTVNVGDLNELVPWTKKQCKIKGAQARMNNLAFSPGQDNTLSVDGIVGPRTRSATRRYQNWAETYSPGNGLAEGELSPVDRIIGPLTAKCLKKTHGV
jgi:hypothetical protein